jgi:ABC-2 type transport system permease protein
VTAPSSARPAAAATAVAADKRLIDRAVVPGVIERVRDVVRHRELLLNLVRKELKVKYKNSSLGFLWSLANPALYLVVFYVVFQLILQSGIPSFPIYLLCGLLPWTFFATAVGGATASVVQNAPLVTKVSFPREILPLATIGAAFVHFLLQTLVLLVALIVFQHSPAWDYMPILIPAVIAMVLFASAVGIFLAAANVYLRDVQHLVELMLLAWFWMTPVVYTYRQVADRMGSWAFIYLLNPMTDVVISFQRALYNILTGPAGGSGGLSHSSGSGALPILPDEPVWWYLRNLGIVIVASSVLLVLALRFFGKCEGNFAEEI